MQWHNSIWASLVAQKLKNLPVIREAWVQSLGQEDLLEKEMTTHSSILAWEIPQTEEPGGLQSMGQIQSMDKFFKEIVIRETDLSKEFGVET